MWDPDARASLERYSLEKRLSSSRSSLRRDLELESRPGIFRDEMQRSGDLLKDQLGRVGAG